MVVKIWKSDDDPIESTKELWKCDFYDCMYDFDYGNITAAKKEKD